MNDNYVDHLYEEYKDSEIEEKTIMLIEDYSSGAYGVISDIFYCLLSDYRYKDYKIVWLCRNYVLTLDIYGELLNDPRIWIVAENGTDFIKYLCKSKYIISGSLMPEQFVKRKEQQLYFVPTELLLARNVYTSDLINDFVPTINNSDTIFFNKKMRNLSKYADIINVPFRYLPEMEPRKIALTDKPFIFVSLLQNRRALCSLSVFEYMYNTITDIAKLYGAEVHWKVSLSFIKKIRDDDRAVIDYTNIHSNEESCNDFFKLSMLNITDTITDASRSTLFGQPTILFYNAKIGKDFEKFVCGCSVVFCFERLLLCLEEKLSHKHINDTKSFSDKPLLFDCPPVLGGPSTVKKISSPGDQRQFDIEKIIERKKRVLLVMTAPSDMSQLQYFNDYLKKYMEHNDITVLLTELDTSSFKNRISQYPVNIKYVSRPPLMTGDSIIHSGKCAARAWNRMVGTVAFDVAFLENKDDALWKKMYKSVPSSVVFHFDKEDIAGEKDFLYELSNCF